MGQDRGTYIRRSAGGLKSKASCPQCAGSVRVGFINTALKTIEYRCNSKACNTFHKENY